MPKVTEEHRHAKRLEILSAAEGVLLRQGYEATTMKDIVEASGKSFGGVYMYYKNKEELFYDLLKRRYAEMEPDFAQAERRTAWEALELFMEGQRKRAEKAADGLAPVMYEFFIAGRRDDKRKALQEERYKAVHGAVRKLLQQGIERGEFAPKEQADTVAHALVSFLDGVFMEAILNGHERIGLREQFGFMVRVLETALGREKAGR
ncbi:TetR family transcriptional regulator [Paenibacillus sp. MBLB4367]|uniref:TetR family transcriptional regulator n=1 Tax=Paenibacillus sp. MBLB4367 TaxID=3384767 RepID=UPI003907FDDC